jgi:hypothetical protein
LTEWNTEKFVKKLRGENDIEATIQRLDKLTLDEVRATAAQTLQVIYGLVRYRRAIMDGEKTLPDPFLLCFPLNFHTPRRSIGSYYLACSRYVSSLLATTRRYSI